MIAVVTPNFEKSTYANQEAGITLGRGKPVISLNFAKELPGFLESIQAIHASEATIGTAVEKAIKVIEGRAPDTYIEPAFKTTQEVEDIAIGEIRRHIERSIGPEVKRTFQFNDAGITVKKVGIDEEKGIFDLAGVVTYTVNYRVNYRNWSLMIDARTGRIINKSVVP